MNEHDNIIWLHRMSIILFICINIKNIFDMCLMKDDLPLVIYHFLWIISKLRSYIEKNAKELVIYLGINEYTFLLEIFCHFCMDCNAIKWANTLKKYLSNIFEGYTI